MYGRYKLLVTVLKCRCPCDEPVCEFALLVLFLFLLSAHVLSTSPLRFRPAEERAQPALQAPSGSGSVLGRCAPSVGCSPGPRASAPFSCFVNSCWAARKFHDSSLLVFLHFSASHMGVTCRLW